MNHHKDLAPERQDRLRDTLSKLEDTHVLITDHVVEHGVAFFNAAAQAGLEGVMAKRLSSRYYPGKRSEDWIKIKVAHEDDFDIIGFTRRENINAISALIKSMRGSDPDAA